jgi:hypothetical protein
MGRALIAVGAALAILVGGLALAVFVTRDEDNIQADNVLSEDFTRDVALAHGGDVDLRGLAPFEWTRVLVAAPGTPREAISRRLGYEWTGTSGIEGGYETLILLDDRGKVARFLEYRGAGHFAGLEEPIADLPRERAVFRVSEELVITPKG